MSAPAIVRFGAGDSEVTQCHLNVSTSGLCRGKVFECNPQAWGPASCIATCEVYREGTTVSSERALSMYYEAQACPEELQGV